MNNEPQMNAAIWMRLPGDAQGGEGGETRKIETKTHPDTGDIINFKNYR
jgi:hypothetical protein